MSTCRSSAIPSSSGRFEVHRTNNSIDMRNVARTERSGVLLRLALAVAAMELMCQAVAVEAGLGAIDDDDQMNAGGGVIAGHAHAVHDDGGARALHDALSSRTSTPSPVSMCPACSHPALCATEKDREAAMPDNWEADLDDILNKDGPFNPHHLSSLLRIKKIREQVRARSRRHPQRASSRCAWRR